MDGPNGKPFFTNFCQNHFHNEDYDAASKVSEA
jgi:hypothetical protein